EQPATIAPGMMMISTDDPKVTRSKSSASKKSKTNPRSPTDDTATDDMAQMNAMMAAGASLVPGGMGWPMPPPMQPSQAGLQFPFMPLGPPAGGGPLQMPGGVGGLPPGLPFPPPAIAVPIPAGAPLPHPAQLPPNAQLVPDGRGGHTIIIPPPPGPWNLPFPGPGMMPGPLPTHANGGFPIPIPIPTTASPQRTNVETPSTNDKTTELSTSS
ncbi:13425_t:CDS:2, partial [Acaulospora colombiana]